MNYIEEIERIKLLLRANGYIALAADMTEKQLSGGTGGEVLMIICAWLLKIKSSNPVAYADIKTEAELLIAYANSIGLHPKA